MENFINLHTHSDYSNFRLRDSINNIKDLIDYAIELGHNGIGITEHETIASSIDAQKYYNLAKEKGCEDIEDILNDINSRIDNLEEARRSTYDDDGYYDPYENYSWEDSLMDALDGEMDAYWNID